MVSEEKLVDYLKRVAADLHDTRQRLHEVEGRQHEPVAVVGMACRYPGGVRSPEDLWELVAAGRDAVGGFPTGRGWDLTGLFHDDPDHPGTSYAREGGFLHDADLFDAEFFGISPREAWAMDPQQRLSLEVSWELLERAGIDPAGLKGSQTGVYVGTALTGYVSQPNPLPEAAEGYLGTGNAPSVISGRVAYAFGLEGPTMTVDTACSSSLVAVHLAMQALRQGECKLAIAGGVTVMTNPNMFTEFSRQRGLARDGRCKAFAAAADGTGWGEGAGLILLERLSDAQRNGRRILAVLRGSAVNQDGASNGLTAPNGPSQRRVIRQALANARLTPSDVDVVEAHGTGTTLGDPIEAQAIIATYGQGRSDDRPLWLGSVKSNIGHTQGAAGVAGIIKIAMAMRHGELPATLHVDAPTPHVDWEAGGTRLLTEPQPWKVNGKPRRAGISSFGASGTNAHVVLEEAPEAEEAAVPAPYDGAVLPWILSGRSEAAVRAQAASLAAAVEDSDPLSVGWSLLTSRSTLDWRAVVVGAGREELLAGLDSVVVPGRVVAGDRGPVLVFPGQGSQWLGMGVELLDQSPVFAARMAECERALSSYVDWSLVEVLRSGERLDRVDVVQPVLWAVMVSLAEVWRSYGVTPAAVVGHSQGEIAAACVAGALSLDDGARVVALRSRALRALAGSGAMASLAVPEAEAAGLLADFPEVGVAAVNGPVSTVVSGPSEQVAAVVAAVEGAGERARLIDVDYASHGPGVEAVREELLAGLGQLRPGTADTVFYSTVTAGRIDTGGLDGGYWYTNLRQPVRFADTVTALLADGHRVFIECSPHPVLLPSVQEADDQAVAVPTLRRDQGDLRQLTRAAGDAYTAGVPIDWRRWYPSDPTPAVIDLPTYPFQHQRYWLSPEAGPGNVAAAGLNPTGHPVLAAGMRLPDGGLVLTGALSADGDGWLTDHTVGGQQLLPGAAFVEWATRAGDDAGCPTVEELTLQAPLAVPTTGRVRVQVAISAPDGTGRRGVRIYSSADPAGVEWTRHAEGTLTTARPAADAGEQVWPPAGAEPLDLTGCYERAAEAGYGYGPAFQGLRAAWRDGTDIVAEVSLPEAAGDTDGYGIHPALLDAVLHPTLLAHSSGELRLPFSWNGVTLLASGATEVRVRLTAGGPDTLGVRVADATGQPVLVVADLATRPATAAQMRAAAARVDGLYHLRWEPHPTAVSTAGDDWPTVAGPADVATLAPPASGVALAYPTPAGAAPAEPDARTATDRALALIQAWLARPELADTRLTFVTHGAPDGDLAAAAVWGLVRSAQAEHPGRFTLLDLETGTGEHGVPDVARAAVAEGEPQLAVRAGQLLVPRLARSTTADSGAEAQPVDLRTGTVLVTGGTGTLGALLAEHLVREYGVSDLILASRRGEAAPGAATLREHLTALGARTRIVRLDVTDPRELRDLLAQVPADAPLAGVVHTAGALDDGLVDAWDRERLDRVWAAKATGAWHLHELTRELPLALFLLFSSATGTVGGAGQAGYAAANAFLDALATRRRAAGLPATSLAWGLWAQASEMTSHLGERDLARLRALGMRPLATTHALALMDAALRTAHPVLVGVDLDPAALTTGDALPAVLRGMARPTRRTAASGDDGNALRARLAGLDEAGRHAAVLELVRGVVAGVLGFGSAASVVGGLSFKELGFDSLLAVELRNRLGALTGLRLPATAAFDYPSPVALARFLLDMLMGASRPDSSLRQPSIVDGDPVVVVGVACRYPGGIGSAEDLWDLVAAGGDAVGSFPLGRGWDLAGLFDDDPDRAGTSYARAGGFLADADRFDAGFFGMSPREALATDPQQRLLLEVSWELFERAGIDPGSLRGSSTGVYAGVMYHDYAVGMAGRGEVEGYSLLAGAGSVVSGRVAYSFGLEGPAVSVDTACSSSLVAVHLAAQALRQGECSLAVAGGVTVMATPEVFTEFSRQRGLAKDGRCKPFAAAADGTGWGEGVGLLLLERMSDARRNGHRILAVLRGSAVNQDGASNGLTAPNGPSQQRVIRQALANAGLRPGDVDVVEAHGTGTTLGDPIEAQAIIATYGQERPDREPLWLGSVKSNIGHTQAAAGAAGLIKMMMAMRHHELPVTLHVDAPTPHVDWDAGNVRLLTQSRPWPAGDRPRRAGISSFGASGTNAHVILEEPPPLPAVPAPPRDQPTVLPWILSARDENALRAQAARLADWAADRDPVEVGWSLATTRAALEHRAVVVGGSREELLSGLGSLQSGRPGSLGPGPVFVFPGQGSQWLGMGVELLDQSPVFAARMVECERALSSYVDWSLVEVLRGGERLDRVDVVQPVLWAVMVSLAEVWRSYGVTPAAVVGHSQGEIAAACVAGALSLDDGARVVALRSRALRALAGSGAMASLAVPEAEAAGLLADFPEVGVAAVNGPVSTVVSGPSEQVAAVVAAVEGAGERARLIDVDYASHGPGVEAVREELLAGLGQLRPGTADTVFYSTVTAGRIDTGGLDGGYWYTNLRQPVRFADTVTALLADGYRVFIECSPHPVLLPSVQEADDQAVAVPTLRRDQGDLRQLTRAAGDAYTAGVPIDWRRWYPSDPTPAVIDLPTYPFQHQRYWLAATARSGDVSAAGLDALGHPVLAAGASLPDGGILLTGRISLASASWLTDHTVGGVVLVPGAALAEWAVRAGDEAGCPLVEELTLRTPLIVPATGALKIQIAVDPPGDDGRRAIRIHSRPDEAGAGWTSHAEGTLAPAPTAVDAPAEGIWPPAGAEPLDLTGCYERAAEAGYGYGPAFQGLRAAWRDGTDIVAEVSLPEAAGDTDGYGIHPALLDAVLHPALLLHTGAAPRLRLPFSWNGLALLASGARGVRVRLAVSGEDTLRLSVTDPAGAPVLSVDALVTRPTTVERLRAATARQDAVPGLFTLDWVPLAADPAATPGTWAALRGAPAAWGLPVVDDLDAVAAAAVPDVLLLDLTAPPGPDPSGRALATVESTLALVQDWLSRPAFAAARLALVTRGAVTVSGDATTDPAAAAAWGLVRSAQTENPGRLLLVDLDPATGEPDALTAAVTAALAEDEPQVAVRGGTVLAGRLAPATEPGLRGLGTEGWRLDTGVMSTVDGVMAIPAPGAWAPLAPGEVRVEVHACGVNFRDVVVCLGLVEGQAGIGGEAAGVVLDVGADVTHLAPGDRVMGVFAGAFAPVVVGDARMVAPIPAGLDFAEAAGVPIAFLTAWYGLRHVAELRAGESVLVHAGTGGVGMAAIQIARHLGAEVYATASPGKHPVLAGMGIHERHRASSRDGSFEPAIRDATGGRGVDVVLDSLAGELVDASLRLVAAGGRFVELGKTDIRVPEQVAADHPGVRYRAFDLVSDAGPERVGEMFGELSALFAGGTLRALPTTARPLAQARTALRSMSQARHVGKVVLLPPAPVRPDGTVVITGGTGVLGGHVAAHLAHHWGVRRLVLASRRGPDAPGAAALVERLTAAGAEVRLTRVDVTDAAAVERLIAGIDPEHPVTGVVHASGVLDDALVTAMTPERLRPVWAAKATGLANLVAATAHLRLGFLVVFSSLTGLAGTPGQAGYAAANAFCDALVASRQDGLSIGWGLWADASGMTGHLGDADLARMARLGVRPLSTPHGLRLLDAAARHGASYVVAADVGARPGDGLPAVFRAVAAAAGRAPRAAAGTASAPVDWAGRLAGLTAPEQERLLLDLVRASAATVLGHADPRAVRADAPFKDLGFDSLTSVELRNRLNAATGLRLPATLVFRYPTPAAVAGHLRAELGPEPGSGDPVGQVATGLGGPLLTPLARLEQALSADLPDGDARGELARRLEALLSRVNDGTSTTTAVDATVLASASDEEMFALIDRELSA